MKNDKTVTLRLSDDLLRRLCYVADAEHRTPNNHMIHLLRQNIAYFERVHGKISPQALRDIDVGDISGTDGTGNDDTATLPGSEQ